jgi:hypothetical protein
MSRFTIGTKAKRHASAFTSHLAQLAEPVVVSLPFSKRRVSSALCTVTIDPLYHCRSGSVWSPALSALFSLARFLKARNEICIREWMFPYKIRVIASTSVE